MTSSFADEKEVGKAKTKASIPESFTPRIYKISRPGTASNSMPRSPEILLPP